MALDVCEDGNPTPRVYLLQVPGVLAWRPGPESQGRRPVEDRVVCSAMPCGRHQHSLRHRCLLAVLVLPGYLQHQVSLLAVVLKCGAAHRACLFDM